MITVERLQSGSKASIEDIHGLLLQLRRDKGEPLGTQSDLDTITGDANVIFVVAKDGDTIAGMATVYLATKFGKRVGLVEDVVVDEKYRGQGLGQKIMEKILNEAKEAGAMQLFLTSGKDRVAAQSLYQKMGFKKRDTEVFVLHF